MLAALGLMALSAGRLAGAEIRLRERCRGADALITLGDLAEIRTNDRATRDELERLELFPVPAAGGRSIVTARELQDALTLHGVDVSQHRFTGASQVEVLPTTTPKARPKPVGGQSSGAAATADRRIRQSLAEFLLEEYRRQNPTEANLRQCPWEVECEIPVEVARLVGAWVQDLRVESVESPTLEEPTGDDVAAEVALFHFACRTADGEQEFSLAATISPRRRIVVAKRNIPVGELLQADDLDLAPLPPGQDASKLFTSIEEVAGAEAAQGLAVERAILRGAVRTPRLVKRNEIVTVVARSGRVKVQTQAKAHQDGGLDDTITVESLETRERFYARVTDVQEVEAAPTTIKVERNPARAKIGRRAPALPRLSAKPGSPSRVVRPQPAASKPNSRKTL